MGLELRCFVKLLFLKVMSEYAHAGNCLFTNYCIAVTIETAVNNKQYGLFSAIQAKASQFILPLDSLYMSWDCFVHTWDSPIMLSVLLLIFDCDLQKMLLLSENLEFQRSQLFRTRLNGLHFSSTTNYFQHYGRVSKQFHHIKGLQRFHISRYNHIHQLKPFGVTSFWFYSS